MQCVVSCIFIVLNSEYTVLSDLQFSKKLPLLFLHPSCYSQLKETLTNRDREISSLRRQLDAAHKELDDVGRSKEVSFKENRRLQDDLATMARENQV